MVGEISGSEQSARGEAGGPVSYDTAMEIKGHGIDLVEVARIERMLGDHGERFLERCFTAGERGYADAGDRRRGERYAARFAAKEAVLKALGTGWRDGIAWTDIEVVRQPSGSPALRIGGRCEQIATDLGITDWTLSLSHTDTSAVASAIASGPE
jgi:holo-[acyl-carrier protein] synthase